MWAGNKKNWVICIYLLYIYRGWSPSQLYRDDKHHWFHVMWAFSAHKATSSYLWLRHMAEKHIERINGLGLKRIGWRVVLHYQTFNTGKPETDGFQVWNLRDSHHFQVLSLLVVSGGVNSWRFLWGKGSWLDQDKQSLQKSWLLEVFGITGVGRPCKHFSVILPKTVRN